MPADDLGVGTLGVYGGSSYETLELDRIAAAGKRFENGHSHRLCTPTRVGLMTGPGIPSLAQSTPRSITRHEND